MRPYLSIVVPARHEPGLGRFLLELSQTLLTSTEIIVAGDDDDLETLVLAQGFCHPFINAWTVAGPPLGYGTAVRRALATARGDWVTIMTADGSDDPADLLKMLDVARQDDTDMVLGHRFIEGATVTGYPWFKRVANRVGNYFAAALFLFPYTDLTNPFKLYRRSLAQFALKRCQADDFSLGLELILAAIKLESEVFGGPVRWRIVPTSWRERTTGASKFRAKHAWGYLRTLWRATA